MPGNTNIFIQEKKLNLFFFILKHVIIYQRVIITSNKMKWKSQLYGYTESKHNHHQSSFNCNARDFLYFNIRCRYCIFILFCFIFYFNPNPIMLLLIYIKCVIALSLAYIAKQIIFLSYFQMQAKIVAHSISLWTKTISS